MSSDLPTTTETVQFISREEYEQWQRTLEEVSDSASGIVRVSKDRLSKIKITDAFLEAFELIGGVPRLAIWANDNPSTFFKLLAKVAPQQLEVSGEHIIRHVLPRSKLDE